MVRRRVNPIDQRLAAQTHKLQIVRIQAADAIGWSIQHAMRQQVARVEALIMRASKMSEPWTAKRLDWLRTSIDEAFNVMMADAEDAYHDSLHDFAITSYDWARKLLIRTLPRWYFRNIVPTAIIGEATATPPLGPNPPQPIKPKRIVFAERAFDKYVAPALEVASYVEPVTKAARMSDQEWEGFASEVIFPSLTLSQIETLAESDQWRKTFPGNKSKFNDPTFRESLVRGIAEGDDVEKLTKRIRSLEDGVYWKARRTARTESLRVSEMAQRETWDDLGEMMAGAQILAVLDQNTRPEHAARNGQIYAKQPQAGELPLDELPGLPDAPNSVVPGTWVQGSVMAASKANYSGQVVELVTSSGRRCSITFNHPVLTVNGFRKAGFIREGDDLVAYCNDVRRISFWANDVQQKPALIEDVFRSLSEVRALIRPPHSGRNFHGDAICFHGEVEIVSPKWKLVRRDDVSLGQFQGDLIFQRSAQFCGSAARVCKGSQGGVGVVTASTRPTAGTGTFLNMRGVSIEAELSSIGAAANLDIRFLEPRSDQSPRDAERVRNLQERFSGQVTLDRVVQVNRFHYSGLVYDLQTSTGIMVANCRNDGNGLVISNCRCWTVPVMVPPDEVASDPGLTAIFENTAGANIPDPAAYDKWFEQADEGARKLAVGTVRYNDMAGMLTGVRRPEWSDFIDPQTGSLLGRNDLRRETDAEREERKAAAHELFRQREAAVQEVAAKGYIAR